MSRVLGVDLGARRIGLAVSDPTGRVATPHGIMERPPAAQGAGALVEAILAEARRLGACRIVVGVPRSLDGRIGPAARAVLEEVERLRRAAPAGVTVDTADERFTTVVATRAGACAPAGRRRARRPARRRRPLDDAAATVMLQSWLDEHRDETADRCGQAGPGPPHPEEDR